MDSDVVEVVARFGGTILDVAHVGPADTYRIGTAQGTNLSVPGLTCFPLVTGGKVRHPVGVPVVERDGWTEIRVGALSIHITRTKLARAPLARPRIQWRTPAFLAASLVVHIAIWFVALLHAPIEKLPAQKPRPRLVHVEVAPPEPPPKPAPHEATENERKKASVAAVQPSRRPRVPREERDERITTTEAAVAAMARSFDAIDLAGKMADLRPEDTYREDEANARGFGGGGTGRRFDPGPAESIASGPYATMIFDVKLCPNKACTVEGPVPALFVRTHLLAHMDEIYACYMEHASEPGTIVLSFTITPDGAVRDARGTGLGETGPCAARVVGEIFFKALGNDYVPPRSTYVRRYPVRFNPARG
ncbi:MAG TPA: hypothetical protein VFV99_25295 [Kofleriaceae bacterium]|nr:hypothetical protein [Kofleriaceae bacterium]